jgi:hypothetical protein
MYFHESAVVLYQLAVLSLNVAVVDLQNALGTSGADEIPQAMSNLSRWANFRLNGAQTVALGSIKFISSVMTQVAPPASVQRPVPGPYEIITFFFNSVLIWAFVSVGNTVNKSQLLRAIKNDDSLRNGPFFAVIEKALTSTSPLPIRRPARTFSTAQTSSGTDSSTSGVRHDPTAFRDDELGSVHRTAGAAGIGNEGDPRIVMRRAAETLSRLGTWGASLNLALLLHQRAKM